MSPWRWLCEAIFPARCICCKREGNWFCSRHDSFPAAPRNEAHFQYLDRCYAGTAYYNAISRKTVEFFKFRGFASLAEKMSDVIQQKIPKDEFNSVVIIPIPLHWSRKLWRGFNQAEKISRALVKKFPGCEISLDLKRIRRTKQQATLSKEERKNNLEKAFLWTGKSVPQKVILVDDVVASGRTLDMAAKVLHEAGVKEVVGVVFARGGKPCENLRNED